MWASLKGRLDMGRELLNDSRVDLTVRNKAGSTVLDIARNCKMHEIASFLERREWEATRRDL